MKRPFSAVEIQNQVVTGYSSRLRSYIWKKQPRQGLCRGCGGQGMVRGDVLLGATFPEVAQQDEDIIGVDQAVFIEVGVGT